MIHPCRDIWIKAADGAAGEDTDLWTEACCQILTQAQNERHVWFRVFWRDPVLSEQFISS